MCVLHRHKALQPERRTALDFEHTVYSLIKPVYQLEATVLGEHYTNSERSTLLCEVYPSAIIGSFYSTRKTCILYSYIASVLVKSLQHPSSSKQSPIKNNLPLSDVAVLNIPKRASYIRLLPSECERFAGPASLLPNQCQVRQRSS